MICRQPEEAKLPGISKIVVRFSALLAFAVVVPLSAESPRDTPNILWIMIDDLRKDALGCYGTPWARTPNIDAIAARGVRFGHAYVQNVVCRSSRLSILTGQYCHDLQDMAMGVDADVPPPYYKDKPTPHRIDLRVALAERGMAPFNVGKTHWDDRWEMVPHAVPIRADWEQQHGSKTPYDIIKLTAPQMYPPDRLLASRTWTIGGGNPFPFERTEPGVVTDAAMGKLEELTAQDKPFFLRISYTSPHIPILSPPQFMVPPDSVNLRYPTVEEMKKKPDFERLQLAQYASVRHLPRSHIQVARGSYYGLVSFVDYQVGRIMEFLEQRGELGNTLIVVNSDHGLQLGEHGLYKKRNFYDQTVGVPLIFSWPEKLPQGVVVEELVEMVDFMPTLLDLLNVNVPDRIAGRSMLPLIRGEETRWRGAVFSEIDHSMSLYTALRVGSGRRVMIRTRDWKMIYFRDARVTKEDGGLYYLKKDPEEIHNLFRDESLAEVVALLKRAVEDWETGSGTFR